MNARAFGRGPILGDRLVRFVYVDEAGTSAKEPVAVVAGAIINADTQWRQIERRLDEVREKHLPPEIREGFIFHAKTLFSGGKLLNRENGWPLERRLPIVKDVLSIPAELNVPVSFGFVRKTERNRASSHLAAFSFCIKAANDLIHVNFKDEIATVVAEDVPHLKAQLNNARKIYRSESAPWWLIKHPYDAIVDRIHFAEKSEAPLLQIADHCAFALRHYMSGHKYGDEVMSYFDATIVNEPIPKDWPGGMGYVLKEPSKWLW